MREQCGEIDETEFRTPAGRAVAITAEDNGVLRVGPGVTGFFLVPIAPSDVSIDPSLVGPWSQYEISEQDFLVRPDGFEQALNDPVRIAVARGDGGPWLKVNADGRARGRGKFVTFDLTLREIDGEHAFTVDAPGCRDRPRTLRILPDTQALVLQEKIIGEAADEIRIRTYIFRR